MNIWRNSFGFIAAMMIVAAFAMACFAQPANNWQEAPPMQQAREQPAPPPPGNTIQSGNNIDPNRLLMDASTLEQQQQFDEAAVKYLEIFKKFPDHPLAVQGILKAAEATTSSGRPADAIALYETAADRFPDNVEVINAHFVMSTLYENLGRYDDAVDALEHVIKAGRPFEGKNASRFLVELYFRLDRTYEAQALSEKILQENPNDVQFLLTLAHSYEREGNYEMAARIFRNIIKVYPNNTGYEYKLYNTLKQGGLLEDYYEELQKEKKKNPGDMEIVHRLARFYLWDDRSLDALVEFEIIVKREPDNLQDAVTLAEQYYRNQWKTKARETLEKVLAKNPDYEPALRQLGNLYFRDEDKEKAMELWRRGAKFMPGDEGAYRRLANMMLPMGLYAEASQLYETGRKELKNDKMFGQELAFIYEKQMQKEKALSEYVSLVEFNPGQKQWAAQILKLSHEEELEEKAPQLLLDTLARRPNNQELRLIACEVLLVAREMDASEAEVRKLAGETDKPSAFLVELAARRSGRGVLKQAARLYEIAAEYPGPHRPSALLQAGRARLAVGDRNEAEAAFRRLAKEGPGTPGVDEALNLLAGISEDQGRYAEARGIYASLAAEHPSSPWYESALVGEARCAFYSGDIENAKEAFDALAGRPASNRYYDEIMFFRAETRYLTLDMKGANDMYKWLADQYPESRRVNDAITRMMFLEDAADADPIHVQAAVAAEKLAMQGKRDSAESVLRGLVMDLEDGALKEHASLLLGELLVASERYEEAGEVLSGMLKKQQAENPPAGARFALAAKVESLPPGEMAARAGYMLAEVYYHMGKREEALRKCQAVISTNPHSYWARRARNLASSMAEK